MVVNSVYYSSVFVYLRTFGSPTWSVRCKNMAYPGEDYKMSNYGYKAYNPEQIKEQWRETTTREIKISKQHATAKPLIKVS